METPRKSSEVTDFPYGYPGRVCYLEQSGDDVSYCRYRDDIRDAVRRAKNGETKLFAAWPGEWRTDLFLVDDLDALAAAVNA